MKMAVVPGLAAVIAVLALFGEPAHALSTGCSAISGNIVQNCGFETGDTSNWTGGTFANGDFVSSAFAHNGTYGLGFGNDGATTPLSQNSPTSTGTTYAISFWVDGQALYTDEISLSWGGTRILDVVDIPAGWTKYSFTETASAGSTVLQFGSGTIRRSTCLMISPSRPLI